jgi:hypothetical protein
MDSQKANLVLTIEQGYKATEKKSTACADKVTGCAEIYVECYTF